MNLTDKEKDDITDDVIESRDVEEDDLTTVYQKGYADAEEKYRKRIKELIEKNYIPKQKIKDEIEALRKMLKATMKGILQEYTPEEIIIKINTLEELLEDK